jgi:TfoX/Sxy family transcriptional regulator of competence genes
VAYDDALADRIREQLHDQQGVTEKAMFGGLAFLINGNMAVSASGQGGLLLRVDPSAAASLVSEGVAERAVMRGRAMDGWLRVADEAVADDRQLARWVQVGVGYAAGLPPK